MNDRRILGAKLDRIAEQVLKQAAQLVLVGHHGRQGIVGDRGSVFLHRASQIRDSIRKDRLAVGTCNFAARELPRSGAQLEAFFNDYQASVQINPLPFVSTVDSVETPRGSGAQRTVEYSICRIVPVPPRGYACSAPGGGP